MEIRINLSGMLLIPNLMCDSCHKVINQADDAIGIIQLTNLEHQDIIHKHCKDIFLKYL